MNNQFVRDIGINSNSYTKHLNNIRFHNSLSIPKNIVRKVKKKIYYLIEKFEFFKHIITQCIVVKHIIQYLDLDFILSPCASPIIVKLSS